MKVYLVGGAVRDRLLHLPVHERDYVVVGASVQDMLQLGFQQVGKDFPVFLHPETKEEYALARKERKVGLGYTGFTFDASPFVTLEDDLLRRDLTINAIAEDEAGCLTDPFQGQADLMRKCLRHVSPAFVEDPVRILRLARFAARFAALGFTVAPETMALMQQMVKLGEVDALVPDRVWKEFDRTLQASKPQAFFAVLAEAHALPLLFPMWQVSNPGIAALATISDRIYANEVKFAVLAHALTVGELADLVKRYPVPNGYRELAELVIRFYADYARAGNLTAEELLQFFQSVDGFRREERYRKCLTVFEIIANFRHDVVTPDRLDRAFHAAKSVQLSAILKGHEKGPEIATLLKNHRMMAIQHILS